MQIVEPLLGTRAEVNVTASSAAAASAAEAAVLREVARLEQIFTVFDTSSALVQLRQTGTTSVPELAEVVAHAEYWRERSHGAFDPRLQVLMDLWDQAEATGVTPSEKVLASAISSRDRRGTAGFDNLNAIAKGWIAQAAVSEVAASDRNIDAVWLNLGGDLVHRGAGSTIVAVEDPHRPYDNAAPIATIEIANEALATSGGARRWWLINGNRYPKTLDPRTGQPVDRVASATVVAADAAVADVLATIATVAEPAATLTLVEAADAECLLIHRDRSRTSTSDRFVTG